MVQAFTKTRNYAILAIVLIIAIMAVGANSSPVAADPCIAQLNYPVMPTSYSYSTLPVSVPISATCTTYYGTQLYATGNAYDITSNTGLGTVSTALQSADGNTFSGQLNFNLPSLTQGHTVQFSVSIYNNQYGNQITSTSETLQLGFGGGTPQVITTTVTQAYPYPAQNEYYPQNQPPYAYPSPSSPYSQQPSQQHPYRNWNDSARAQYLNRIQDSSRFFDLVAIAAILAAVIIATAGLVVYGRRQQPVAWIPPPPPPR